MSLPGVLRCSSKVDNTRCDLPNFLPHTRHHHKVEHGGSYWSTETTWMRTAEQSQPWVIYTYGRSHDGWWPIWSSTRMLGYARIGLECIVCGKREVVKIPMPRFGPVPEPASGRHPERERFLAEHAHPDRGAPMSWARPLTNLAAHQGGLDLDALAMRLEADINEGTESGDSGDGI